MTFADAVLLSDDQHADNLDPAGRNFLAKARRVLTTRVVAERLGSGAVGLSPWRGGHAGPERSQAADRNCNACTGRAYWVEPLAGEVTGLLLGIDEPGDLLYVTGDTV